VAFQLLPEFPPHTRGSTCSACNCSRREYDRIIDPNITIEFEGHLMLCETCVAEMARLIGFIDPAKATDLSEKLARADVLIADLHKELDDKTELEDLLRRAGTYLAPSDIAPVTTPTSRAKVAAK
jgi:hypothetical protein